ncbi:hypothetical protein [Yoonia sp.]|uniref:hypothetical protein n=1 Tax=Yoonia sp. TaxID=2212373 RepID=UPI00344BC4F3
MIPSVRNRGQTIGHAQFRTDIQIQHRRLKRVNPAKPQTRMIDSAYRSNARPALVRIAPPWAG